jgi:hypothetical protein
MGDYTPVSGDDPEPFTLTAGGTIGGGALVSISAGANDTVVQSTTGDHSIGVAGFDAVSGQRVLIYPLPGVIHEIVVQTAGSAPAAGDPISAGTTGTVVKSATSMATAAAAGILLGICVRGAAAGAKCRFIGI